MSLPWVKGHATHADNNRADKLASEAAKMQISTKG
jgi:ribonuclease HI